MRNPVMVEEGSRLTMKCEASGTPPLSYKWYKDGTVLKKSKEIKIKGSKKNSKIQIASARLEDSGNYMCVVENEGGSSNSTSTVHVQSITTTLPPGSGHARRCNDTEKGYCVNDGECYFIHGINQLSCKCPPGYFGPRCLQPEPLRLQMPKPSEKAEELYQKRVLTITGICVALLVVGIVCVVAYCKTNLPPRKQRKKMHNHLRQNMCVDHPNRNLANGPNHPGPGPEEIPMVDYISKNVPATERVIRHGAEASFSGSRQSSRSHNSSTRAHSSTHRYVSALTTPARLSPVDFHYSLPQQVPTFQITSPNASHAASLPPAARAPYPPPQEEEDHPLLLRRYQVPLHEAQRYQPYRQQHQQRQSYLRDSPGSLPSSPQLPAQDEEYESTQEYPASASSLEQPKRSGRRSWRRSRLNGHVAPRGYRPPRDYGSRSCLSDSGSEEEEEEEGESTPFLSMQNMSIPEPSTIYRPAPPVASDTRTPHSAAGRHAARSSTQGSSSSRQTHARSKPDRAAH
uniref:Neuregulin 2a n=1 Tax=Pygocentrus nattereri TaxID=42514 RepID=A0A3B4DW69_PYGNA